MALSNPRKTVPLSTGEEWPAKPAVSLKRRAFFGAVVAEYDTEDNRYSKDTQDLLDSLGHSVPPVLEATSSRSRSNSDAAYDRERAQSAPGARRKRALTNVSELQNVVNELVATERTYVERLRILKHVYADPIRESARKRDSPILAAYEANTLFANVENLLPVNEAFLADLETMLEPDGKEAVDGVGDVALKHFKTLRGFDNYRQYYSKREEAQTIVEREMNKRGSRFASFIDRVKYSSTTDMKNRVGLRELLMEPIQRIPRYTLLFRSMIKHMAPGDPQYERLSEACEAASQIAHADLNEETKRGSLMYCLSAAIEEFPPGLISNARRFIDSIDVEDMLGGGSLPSPSGSTPNVLHCTLFLFDDKLLIVKRPSGEKGGRTLAGLDELDKGSQTAIPPKKRSGLVCKGVLDVTDLAVTDAGGPDIHIYIENPPVADKSDRWSGRPFRALSVVRPPLSAKEDPLHVEADKRRFLENMWHVQGRYRSRNNQSEVLYTEEQEVATRGGRRTLARTYFNVYQRMDFLKESKKTKVVVHIDSLGAADPIPLGVNGAPPLVVIRLRRLEGDLIRFNVLSTDPNEDAEEEHLPLTEVPTKIVQTIHQYHLFDFRTGNKSSPPTPTHTGRSRAALFSLDAISRNLGLVKSEASGSLSNHRRSKSSASRSSIHTQASTADSSSMKFSHRTSSSTTVATSISTQDGDSVFHDSSLESRRSRRSARSARYSSRSSFSDHEGPPGRPGLHSRSQSATLELEYSDAEETVPRETGTSERNLARRLELARQNSLQQEGEAGPSSLPQDVIVEEALYEEEPPPPALCPTTPRLQSVSPAPAALSLDADVAHLSAGPRSRGPRTPSPVPPNSAVRAVNGSPGTYSSPETVTGRPTTQVDARTSSLQAAMVSEDTEIRHTPLPRSNRMPFSQADSTESQSVASSSTARDTSRVEPLLIKKNSTGRSNDGSSSSSRRLRPRSNPRSNTSYSRPGTPNRVPLARTGDRLLQLAEATKDIVESSHQAVQRVRMEIDRLREPSEEEPRSPATEKSMNLPLAKRTTAPTREAQERMEEMQQMIEKRVGKMPRMRPRSMVEAGALASGSRSPDGIDIQSALRSMDDLTSEAEVNLTRAVSAQELLCRDIRDLSPELVRAEDRLSESDRARIELDYWKRRYRLTQKQLDEAKEENTVLFQTFNEELQALFDSVNLPGDESMDTLKEELSEVILARNSLAQENAELRRQREILELKNRRYRKELQSHGVDI